MARSPIHRTPVKHAVKVKSVYSSCTGRLVQKTRHLDIDAPVGDFSPIKPGDSCRRESTTGR